MEEQQAEVERWTVNLKSRFGLECPRRFLSNGIPDRAGFSFVIKARQQAHGRTMSLLSATRRTDEKTRRMVCHLTEIALVHTFHPSFDSTGTILLRYELSV